MAESMRGCIAKLNNENYQVWKFKIELLLIKEDLWSQVSATAPTDAIQQAAWKKRDDKARATIGLLVEDSQLIHIRKANTAKEVWDSLKNYHEKSTLTSKVYTLKQICNLKLSETGSMEDHIVAMQNLIDKLIALGEVISDSLHAAMYLSSLPESYSTLITALETRPETDLTPELIKGKLIDEYKRRLGVPDASELNTALKVSHKRSTNIRKEVTCYFCQKPGHFKQDCIKYKRWKSNKEKTERANKVNAEKEQTEFVCFSTHQHSTFKDSWYVDSGATSHMTNNKSFFDILKERRMPDVKVANGNGARVAGIGTGKLKCLDKSGKGFIIQLSEVLYVPDLTENLISVKGLTDSGFIVQFKGIECTIIKNNIVVATAELSCNMFKMNMQHEVHVVKNKQHTEKCQHTWHKRFGHRHPEDVQLLKDKNMVLGINIQDCGIRQICECCIKGKMVRQSFPKASKSRATSPLELVHTDLCGPMQTTTPGGMKYFMTMIDDYSRYAEIYFLRNKSDAAHYIKDYVRYVKNKFGKVPNIIRSDNGREYIGSEIKAFFAEEGIRAQYTAPYSPQQNGVAERKNRTLTEAARCMLIDAEMENKYWAEAVNTANYLQNILPTKVIDQTPFELWNKSKPSVGHLRIFGCKGYTRIPKEKRRKLDDKAILLTFVGYSTESKAYRMLNKNTNMITVSRDVRFIEYNVKNIGNKEAAINDKMTHMKEVEMMTNDNKNEQESEEESDDEFQDTDSNLNQTIVSLTDSLDATLEQSDSEQDDSYHYPRTADEFPEEATRKSDRKTKGCPPKRFEHKAKAVKEENKELKNISENLAESNQDTNKNHVLSVEENQNESLSEALSGPYKHEWKTAMNDEYDALVKNGVWELVKCPNGKTPIGSRWVLRTKYNSDGSIERRKARLVARGFAQRPGIEFNETYAPVARLTSIRVMVAIAAELKLDLYQLDITMAYTYGELNEEIYMSQADHFIIPGKEDYVYRLKKSLYGLKQSGRQWFQKLDYHLKHCGLKQLDADPCVYSMKKGNNILIITVYVDDLIVATNNIKLLRRIKENLKKQFKMRDLGTLKYCLGIQFFQDNQTKRVTVNQQKYILDLVRKFNMEEANTTPTPLESKIKLTKEVDSPEISPTKYQSLIGSLMYAAVATRPDIMYAVSALSCFNTCPKKSHWLSAKRVLRYLKGSSNLSLCFRNTKEPLLGYVDSDWGGDVDTRASRTGFVFKLAGAAVSWESKKQGCVAMSSTEAEYMALTEAARETVYLRRLLHDLEFINVKESTTIFCDNQSAAKLVKNPVFHARTKHIDIRHHYVRQVFEDGLINVKYVPTSDMSADVLTKSLPRHAHEKHHLVMGLKGAENSR